jgi:hypothetical protein
MVVRNLDINKYIKILKHNIYNMTTFKLPLEITNEFKTKYGFTSDEGYLDLYQVFSLLNHENISFLFPDNATKIITQIYNNETYNVFEKFINDICINSNTTIVYIKTIDGPKRNNQVRIFNNGNEFPKKKGKISVSDIMTDYKCNALSIIIEYMDSVHATFGHYGASIYYFDENPDKIFMFDSMMNTDSNNPVASSYATIFTDIITNQIFIFDYNGYTDPQIVFDIYRTPDSVGVYPFEITVPCP